MAFAIPHSITVRQVTLHGDEGDVNCRVDNRLVHELPSTGTRVRVTLVKGYVTGVTVQ